MATSNGRIGAAFAVQGNLRDALVAYRAAKAILVMITVKDPSNNSWQRDLAVTDRVIGAALVAQGNLADALQSYRESLAITQRLTSANTGTIWQNDLQQDIARIGGLAYNFVLARDFSTALAAADQAISLAPDQI